MNTGLTSLRALAIFAVFLLHVGLFDAGYLGVQAFFVLSGFLLTPIIIHMKKDLPTKVFFTHFYGRRALRIFPLYFVYLLAATVFALTISYQNNYQGISSIDNFLDQIPWALSYTYNFYHASADYQPSHFVTHFWSLAVEEQFYLLWPLLIFSTPKASMKPLLLALIILGPLIRLAMALIAAKGVLPFFSTEIDVVIYVLPFSHIDAFAIGGYFALYEESRSKNFTRAVIISAIGLGFLTSYLSTGYINILNAGYAPFMQDSYKYVWGYSVLNGVFALILLQTRDRKFCPRLLETRFMQYMGEISYGLYVFHYPVIWLVSEYLNNISVLLLIPLSMFITIAISMLSYELMEKRFINLKDKFFSRDHS
ncbi:MAG: acyltransferase [Pseudomonadales bacterium]|nr:acyltransferase [Pseudomonadales bacterium]